MSHTISHEGIGWFNCFDCNIPSHECYRNHQMVPKSDKIVCYNVKQCPNFCDILDMRERKNKKQPHQCCEYYCKMSEKYVMQNHECFIGKLKHEHFEKCLAIYSFPCETDVTWFKQEGPAWACGEYVPHIDIMNVRIKIRVLHAWFVEWGNPWFCL